LSICIAKEKADHPVIEDSVNKSINDRSQLRLASELLKNSLVHGVRLGLCRMLCLEGIL
jgi:hypothetical protein